VVAGVVDHVILHRARHRVVTPPAGHIRKTDRESRLVVRLKSGLWFLALLIFAFFPTVVTNPAFVTIAVYTLMYMACATSWNMFSGYSGYVALGSAAFFGTGAYTMALASIHWNMAPGAAMFWLVPLGGLVAVIVAIPIGWIALRVRRHTFVVIT